MDGNMRKRLIAAVAGLAVASVSGALTAQEGALERLEVPVVVDAGTLAALIEAEDRRVVTPQLEAFLSDADESIRARALLGFARVGDPTRVAQIGSVLADPSARVRAYAAFALSRLDYDMLAAAAAAKVRAVELLLPLLEDSAPVAAEAAWAVGMIGASASQVRGHLQEGRLPAPVMAALLNVWWRLDGADAATTAGFAAYPLAEVRLAAANTLRRLDDPNGLPTLEKLLLDTNAEVRLAAVRGLREAPLRAAEDHLEALLGDRDRRIVCAALEWVSAGWAAEETVSDETFEAVLRRSFDRALHVRRCALSALSAATGRSVATDRLLEALDESELAVRVQAMGALARMAPDVAVLAVERLTGGDEFDTAALVGERTGTEIDALAALVVAAEEPAWVESWLDAVDGAPRITMLRLLIPVDGASVYRLVAAMPLDDPGVLGLIGAAHAAAPATLDIEAAADLSDRLWRAYYDAPIQGSRRHAALRAFVAIDEPLARRRAELIFEDGDRAIRVWALARWRDEVTLPELSALLAPQWTDRIPEDYRAIAADVIALEESSPRVRFVTERGEFVVALRPDWAPLTSLQFARLAQENRFETASFYRVIAGFVSQGGPADEAGTPRLRNEDAPIEHSRGVIAMALSGRDTGTEHFYVTHAPQPHLRGAYPIFGEVLEGQRVVERLQPGDAMQVVMEPAR
ncbi:MAG: hypothetical protein GKS06_11765 [Acidobacteria bacterium]|nr:hypothetical protein [Acidobacteriota bacterium]